MTSKSRGLIMVNTGDGKGKTTAAIGVVLRALGYDWRTGMVQFIKANTNTGEYRFLSAIDNIDIYVMGHGFTWESNDLEKDKKAAIAAWQKAKEMMRSGDYRLVLLDEITYALNYKFIDIDEVVDVLSHKGEALHVIITGRNCPSQILALADQVTEMLNVKHPFDSGITAQQGVDY